MSSASTHQSLAWEDDAFKIQIMCSLHENGMLPRQERIIQKVGWVERQFVVESKGAEVEEADEAFHSPKKV